MADVRALGARGRKSVRVRVPPRPPSKTEDTLSIRDAEVRGRGGPNESERPGPRSHDAAGGMESRAGGACALGEVGWTFGSVVSYNVTKCDMRRSMCRSDVSVNAC